MANFKDINFRYTDAKNEFLYSPDHFQEAFVDLHSSVSEIARPDKFIVYGPKGAGKTALGVYYELSAQSRWDLFSKIDDLENFDYSLLFESSNTEDIPQTVGAWKFLLAIRLYILLATDQNLLTQNQSLNKLIVDLENMGLMPSPNLVKLAQKSFDKSGNLSLKFFIAEISANLGRNQSFDLKSYNQIADALIDSFSNLVPTSSKYLLFIDGLDHIVRRGSLEFVAISSLIDATRIINEQLLRTHLSAKIVVLIREEVTQIIPNPDLAKRLADNGLLLDWYGGISDPFQTDLFKVIERRAQLVGFKGKIQRHWYEWLPKEMYPKKNSAIYVVERTRFLPRDFIRFFYSLQKLNTQPPFTPQAVVVAENQYSEWFFGELSDALIGLVDNSVRDNINSILRQLGRFFTIDDLENVLAKYNLSQDVSGEALAQILFDTHWIGNYGTNASGKRYFSFKSRNRRAGFSPNLGCVVHAGLRKSLNLNFERRKPKK